MRQKDKTKIFKEKNLKQKDIQVYFNEDLTKDTALLFSKVRKLKQDKHILRTWTNRGNIYYVTKENDTPAMLNNEKELDKLQKNVGTTEN